MRSETARAGFNLAFFIAVGIILVWLVFERIRFEIRELQIKFAREQVELFSETAANAVPLRDAVQLRKSREYIKSYYPSGTKQTKGSNLDLIVERVRREACVRIDARLMELEAIEQPKS
jgi:hypothetical protein